MREARTSLYAQARLSLACLLTLVTVAGAQTPQTPAAGGAQIDGTYKFVSATKVNASYGTATGRMGQCGALRRVGPLMIANGQARYTSGASNLFEGTVGSGGQLTMRLAPRPGNKNTPGIEIMVAGTVDAGGIVRARQSGRLCAYDLVWRKLSE
jgi:hypothetical protein